MIRNLVLALAGAVLILVTGWLTAQPSFHRQLAASPGGRYAVLGLIVVLSLFTVVSLVRAFMPKKKPTARPSSPYAAPAGRK